MLDNLTPTDNAPEAQPNAAIIEAQRLVAEAISASDRLATAALYEHHQTPESLPLADTPIDEPVTVTRPEFAYEKPPVQARPEADPTTEAVQHVGHIGLLLDGYRSAELTSQR